MSIIKMSDTAYTEFKDFLHKNNITKKTIRIFLMGVGCSGPQFNIALDDKNFTDITVQINEITFLVSSDILKQFKGFEIKCPEENGFDSFTIEPFEAGDFNPCSSCSGECHQ